MERIVPSTIIYHKDRRLNECCSEAEVEEWLSRRRCGEETRALITDKDASRGWEARQAHLLVRVGRLLLQGSCCSNISSSSSRQEYHPSSMQEYHHGSMQEYHLSS